MCSCLGPMGGIFIVQPGVANYFPIFYSIVDQYHFVQEAIVATCLLILVTRCNACSIALYCLEIGMSSVLVRLLFFHF